MKKKNHCGGKKEEMGAGDELLRSGIIRQRQQDRVIARFRSLAGNLTAAQLRALADLAEKYGRGSVHLTTRQGVEISAVAMDKAAQLAKEARERGLLAGACGPRVRTVVACPGREVCPYGLVNSRQLAEELDREFFGREVGIKVKIAVSGCPNSCAKPQENDIALMGAVEPVLRAEKCHGCGLCATLCPRGAIKMKEGKPHLNRRLCMGEGSCIAICPAGAWEERRRGLYLFAGGQGGRSPRLGRVVVPFVTEEEATAAVEAVLKTFLQLRREGERLGDTLQRVGLREFRRKVGWTSSAGQRKVGERSHEEV